MAAPLTDLTKKGGFAWTNGAQATFDCLKEVMSCCLILALPDFTQPLTLECGASAEGIGAVLSQGGQPIAFESRKLLPHEKSYFIYDKEILAIINALAKFRQYLVGNWFRVKMDHNSLHHFMGQQCLNDGQ